MCCQTYFVHYFIFSWHGFWLEALDLGRSPDHCILRGWRGRFSSWDLWPLYGPPSCHGTPPVSSLSCLCDGSCSRAFQQPRRQETLIFSVTHACWLMVVGQPGCRLHVSRQGEPQARHLQWLTPQLLPGGWLQESRDLTFPRLPGGWLTELDVWGNWWYIGLALAVG